MLTATSSMRGSQLHSHDLILYLTDFSNRIFPGENAKNHDFFGGEKMKAARLYHSAIYHSAEILARYRILTEHLRQEKPPIRCRQALKRAGMSGPLKTR